MSNVTSIKAVRTSPKLTLTSALAALDADGLLFRAPNGHLWKVRRRGQTIKAGRATVTDVVCGFNHRTTLSSATLKGFVIA